MQLLLANIAGEPECTSYFDLVPVSDIPTAKYEELLVESTYRETRGGTT